MNAILAAAAALGLALAYDGLTSAAGAGAWDVAAAFDRIVDRFGLTRAGGARTVALSPVGGLLVLLVISGVTSSIVTALAFALMAACAPFAYARSRTLKRAGQRREVWPDAIATLVAGVRAGVSLPESCSALAERGPEGVREGFAAFAATYRAAGSFHAGLERLRSELSDPVADRVAVALGLAHEVGGTDLVRVLRTLGDFVREDLRVRKEIEARWSWTVTAARVASAAPWVVLLLMSARPEAAVAYNSSAGVAVIVGGAIATVVGYRLMLRAGKLPEQGRLAR
jgi:tight adherence protein B